MFLEFKKEPDNSPKYLQIKRKCLKLKLEIASLKKYGAGTQGK